MNIPHAIFVVAVIDVLIATGLLIWIFPGNRDVSRGMAFVIVCLAVMFGILL